MCDSMYFIYILQTLETLFVPRIQTPI